MDYFCQQCASKPGWPWDESKAFQHACQRCFRNLPCNDYAWKTGRVKPGVAPRPADLVKTQVNTHAQVDLPKAKVVEPVPQPVYPVEPPASVPVPSVKAHIDADGKTEVDKALDAIQPNRPGVKLTPKAVSKPVVPGKPEPKLELAEKVPTK